MRTFRDFEIGDRERLGPILISKREAFVFASRYDPRPFHLNEPGPEEHPFITGMAASGWLACALMIRLLADEMRANPVAALGSPGVDRLRWRLPLYPGDRLVLETEVVALRLLRNRPEIGLVRKRLRTTNQDRLVVMTMDLSELVAVDAAQPERRHPFHYAA